MTCIIGVLDKDGVTICSDRRIITDSGSLTSDTQSKVWQAEDGSMIVGYAGDVGVAQSWLRKLQEGAGLIESLPGGEGNPAFSFLAYDSVGHQMFLGDASGFLIIKRDILAIGSGADFVMGYFAGVGTKKRTPDVLRAAIRACSKRDLSVSAGSDITRVERQRKR